VSNDEENVKDYLVGWTVSLLVTKLGTTATRLLLQGHSSDVYRSRRRDVVMCILRVDESCLCLHKYYVIMPCD
jgi:hypothetical protein